MQVLIPETFVQHREELILGHGLVRLYNILWDINGWGTRANLASSLDLVLGLPINIGRQMPNVTQILVQNGPDKCQFYSKIEIK